MSIYLAIAAGTLISLVITIRQKIKATRKEADEVLKEHEQSIINLNRISEQSIRLGVLTAYLGARDGLSQGQVLDMLLTELDSRDISAKLDISDIKRQISTGFHMHKNNQKLTSEEVFHQALEHYHLMVR